MKRQLIFTLGLALALVLLVSGVTLAADSYDLSWWTVDDGGGTTQGEGYTLSGTIGQSDAGAIAGGGGYTLVGGFWRGGAAMPAETRVYLPLVIK